MIKNEKGYCNQNSENMINCKEIGLGKDHSVMAQINAKTNTKIEL